MLCEKLLIKTPERSHFVYQDDPVWYFWIVPSISDIAYLTEIIFTFVFYFYFFARMSYFSYLFQSFCLVLDFFIIFLLHTHK